MSLDDDNSIPKYFYQKQRKWPNITKSYNISNMREHDNYLNQMA